MSPDLEPRYSGRHSEKFWRRVKLLQQKNPRAWYACYALGVALQNLESQVLRTLDESERRRLDD